MTRSFMITFLVSAASVLCSARIIRAETANIIYVPTDYATIAAAVAAAPSGATVFISSGVYRDEVVIIRQPLNIVGQRASEVIVGGTNEGSGFSVASDLVNFKNLTSKNRLTTNWFNHIEVRNCILKHQIGFLGSHCVLDGCVVLIPENPPQDDPYFTNVASSGIDMDFGNSGIISNNLLLGVKSTSVGHFEGSQPPFITPTPTVPCTDQFCPGGPQAGYASAIFGLLTGNDTRIVNNTIVNVFGGDTGYFNYEQLERWAIMFPGEANGIRVAYPFNLYLANNIIWNVRGGVPKFPNYDGIWVSPAPSVGLFVGGNELNRSAVIENNLFYDSDYAIVVDIKGGNTDGIVLRNNLWASPGFVNPASGDYHLLPNSPAIDAGTPIAWLTQDAEGNPRPSNFGWDIGAFEYQKLLSDLNNDGKVDSLDLNEFVRQWGLELPNVEKSAKPAKAMIVYITPTPVPKLGITPAPSAILDKE